MVAADTVVPAAVGNKGGEGAGEASSWAGPFRTDEGSVLVAWRALWTAS